MISAVIALLLIGQAMSQAEMIEEGDDIGRSAFAMGVCDSMGYTVHDDAAGRWGDDFFERGASAGWSTETLRSAFDAGGRNEEADIDLTVPDRGVDNSAFVASVNSYIESLRDFWLSQSDLEMSLIGRPNFSAMGEMGTAEQR